MAKPTGLQGYKEYWEAQAEFMDKNPWAVGKVLKINLQSDYEILLKGLGLSNHSISKEDKKIIVKIKIPHNYFELDSFETKALELLGIQKNWVIDISIDASHCKSSRW